jgi:hypothetical protein
MEPFIQSLDSLVNSHSAAFDKGLRLNKQLKLIDIYIKNLYMDPKTYDTIAVNNKHFQEYKSTEFENVLTSFGFVRHQDSLKFQGDLSSISYETISKLLQDSKYLNFAEIVQIVQSGQKPPGIKEILEQPIGLQTGSLSQPRPKKPWVN